MIERGGQGATPAASCGISASRLPTTFPSRAVGPTDACVSALPSATPDDSPRRRLSQSHQLLFKDPRCWLDHLAPIASATPVCAPWGADPAFASCRLRPRIAGPGVCRGVLLRWMNSSKTLLIIQAKFCLVLAEIWFCLGNSNPALRKFGLRKADLRKSLLHLQVSKYCATLYKHTGVYMSKDRKKVLGARLRAARVAAKLSQDFVAETMGVTRQSVSAWETGCACPSALQLGQLAAAYCVCAHTLLFGEAFMSLRLRQMLSGRTNAIQQSELMTRE